MKQFKFFNGKIYTDEYTVPAQPEGISNRHWNILPQDLRGGGWEDMSIYIEGWEAARNNITMNPYVGINDNVMIEWSELWSRGRLAFHNRIEQNYRNVNFNPPIDERYPEYYNTEDFVFCDVTETRHDSIDGRPFKVMLYRSIEDGNTIEGNRIHPEHPMWNFPDVI
jgi:hypothetical protein